MKGKFLETSETNLLMKKCRNMKVQSARDKTEAAESTKSINKKKAEECEKL